MLGSGLPSNPTLPISRKQFLGPSGNSVGQHRQMRRQDFSGISPVAGLPQRVRASRLFRQRLSLQLMVPDAPDHSDRFPHRR